MQVVVAATRGEESIVREFTSYAEAGKWADEATAQFFDVQMAESMCGIDGAKLKDIRHKAVLKEVENTDQFLRADSYWAVSPSGEKLFKIAGYMEQAEELLDRYNYDLVGHNRSIINAAMPGKVTLSTNNIQVEQYVGDLMRLIHSISAVDNSIKVEFKGGKTYIDWI